MTYPNDPNQGGWNPGSQGQRGGSAWDDLGRQGPPPPPASGQQPPPTQAFGWQPAQYGAPPPPAQFGQQPPGGMPPGPPYGPPPQDWGPSGPGGPPRRSQAGLWIALAVVVLLIAGGVTTWLVLRNTGSTTADPGSTTTPTIQSAPIDPTEKSKTTGEKTTAEPTTDGVTTAEQKTDEQTTAEPSTDEGTTDAPTTEESTTAASTTEASTTEASTTEESTTASKDPTPAVAIGDCLKVDNADSVVITESLVDCGAADAVYEVTDIVASKTECDPTEANLPGTSGGLPDQVLCLLATLKKGDCWRAKGASNGDYEKIDCGKAKSTDNKVVFESRTDADPAQCPKGTQALSYKKRKVLFCYAPAS